MSGQSSVITRGVRPLRILCAEDNTQLGDIMLCLFARGGHWVEHVEDGAKAWARLEKDVTNYDVLVTDHSMPVMNGLQLVTRARGANFQGRIVVHTSSLNAADTARYRDMGVAAIVMKAARADDLINAVTGAASGSA